MSRVQNVDGYDRIMVTNFVNLSDGIGRCGLRETLQGRSQDSAKNRKNIVYNKTGSLILLNSSDVLELLK
jgi:hypothetical protein